MKISKTNGCEVKSTNSTIKVETVNVKGKDILVFTTKKGSKVQFLEEHLVPVGENTFTHIGHKFCVYNQDFSKRYLINQRLVTHFVEDWNPYPFIINREKDTLIPLNEETIVSQSGWIEDVPTFEEWSEISKGCNEFHDFIEDNDYLWYDSHLESGEEMDMNPAVESVIILKDTIRK